MTQVQQFFHTLDEQGQVDRQGRVLDRVTGRVTVEFFSWLDGEANGTQTVDEAETRAWRFYGLESEWRQAGDKVFA